MDEQIGPTALPQPPRSRFAEGSPPAGYRLPMSASFREGLERPQGWKHVYVIEGHNWCKLGISTNPAKRISSIQTAHPWPLRIACSLFAPVLAPQIEWQAHRLLGRPGKGHRRNRYIQGEWFNGRWEQGRDAILRVVLAMLASHQRPDVVAMLVAGGSTPEYRSLLEDDFPELARGIKPFWLHGYGW